MRAFHMIMSEGRLPAPRRVDFEAESPDHAFQVARNEDDGIEVELWEGKQLLARMTKSGAGIWKLHGNPEPGASGPRVPNDHFGMRPA